MNKTRPFSFHFLALSTCVLSLSGLYAQPPTGAGKGGDGKAGEGKIGRHMGGRGQGVHGLGDLSEQDRRKVREALKEVWGSEDLRGARKQLTEASENYREVLRQAIAEVDPDVRDILARVLPDGGMPPSGKPSGPPPFGPEGRLLGDVMQEGFAEKIFDRLHSDCQRRLGKELHELLNDAHASVVTNEKLETLRVSLAAMDIPKERFEAARELRTLYQAALVKTAPELAGKLKQQEGKMGSPRQGGEARGAGRKGERGAPPKP